MKGIVSVLLIGSLAFVLGSSNNAPVGESDNKQQEQSEVPSPPELSKVFPNGNVPLNPEDFKSSDSSPQEVTNLPQQREYSQQISEIDERIRQHSQDQKSGQVYRFEFPEEGESAGEQEVELQGQSPSTASYNGGTYQPEDDSNNAKKNTQQERVTFDSIKPSKKPKKGKGDFTSIQDFQNENRRNNKKQYAKENYKKQQKIVSENGTVIEGAGTGFHPDSVLIHPELPAEGHGHHYEHGKVLHEIVEPHHVIVDQGHHPVGHGHGLPPTELDEHHIYHPKSHAKPLKASVVHRDPHDSFDHHDRIRTQDKDVPHHHHEHQVHHHDHDNHGHGVHEEEKDGFKPYKYDMHKLPECAHKNKHYYNLTFCLEDHQYPLETILWAIHSAGPHVHQLLSDVTYQSADNLVTGLTRAEEEGYTYKHYFGATHAQHTQLAQFKPPYKGYTYSADYFKKGGYICPSDIYYGRPKRAMNTYGKWKVIVNIDQIPKPHIVPHHGHGQDLGKKKKRGAIYDFDHQDVHHPKLYKKPYTQTLRLEQCIYPNAPCSYIDSHFHSSCIQKHNFVRLVAWTKEEGLHIDTFKMPIACSCHIRQPIHFYHETSHHVEKEGYVVPPVNVYDHAHHHDGSGLQHHSPPGHKK